MRTGAPAGRPGFIHEAAFYGSDDEFLAVVVPFLEQGADAGEPALVGLGESTTELLRGAGVDTTGLVFLDDGTGRFTRPASVLEANREFFAARVADGAGQIRFVGEIPHPGLSARWGWWARYEATVNHAFARFPTWSLCLYDMRITPDAVVADVVRTHPHLVTADGRHRPNRDYQEPAEFLARRPPGEIDPLEATAPPVVDLVDPTPAAARDVVRLAAAATLLTAEEVDDVVLSVSEAVTNALCHGRPPVRFRLWSVPERVVATVSDGGEGPADPFAGLLPTTRTESGGLGLWLIHQVCDYVELDRTDHGFTVRLVAEAAAAGKDGHVR